jgi:hypothetical protein
LCKQTAKSSLPSGLRTRPFSRNAANGSAIEQNVQVITTVSIVRERDRGRRPLQKFGADTGRGSASACNREQPGRRVSPEYDLDLLAIERKVQFRSDPDFEHPPVSSGNHLAAMLLELVLPHDQTEDR